VDKKLMGRTPPALVDGIIDGLALVKHPASKDTAFAQQTQERAVALGDNDKGVWVKEDSMSPDVDDLRESLSADVELSDDKLQSLYEAGALNLEDDKMPEGGEEVEPEEEEEEEDGMDVGEMMAEMEDMKQEMKEMQEREDELESEMMEMKNHMEDYDMGEMEGRFGGRPRGTVRSQRQNHRA